MAFFFLFCILETHSNVLSFVGLLCCFCLHITEYEQIRGGAQNFLGPRGVKYLNTGLSGAITVTPGNAFVTRTGATLLYKQRGGMEV